MYGTVEPENVSYREYATKLQESLTKAYKLVHESLAEKQEMQTELYNKKVHGELYEVGVLVWLLNPQVSWGKSNSTSGGGDHLRLLSASGYQKWHIFCIIMSDAVKFT